MAAYRAPTSRPCEAARRGRTAPTMCAARVRPKKRVASQPRLSQRRSSWGRSCGHHRGHGNERTPSTSEREASAMPTRTATATVRRARCGSRPLCHGEKQGMVSPHLGDEREKGGENVWISRNSIDLVRREAQPVLSSETKACRTSSEHRKVGAREAQREAARQNGGKPRECCKAGSRDGSEPRKGSVTGVGWRIRSEMVRGVPRRLPWSCRGRLGWRLSDTTPARCQRDIVDVAPRSTGGFGRSVTRGCVASGPRCGAALPLSV